MSYLRHIEACNRFDPDAYLPFLLGSQRVGFIRRDRAKALANFPDLIQIGLDAIRFAPSLDTAARRSEALAEIGRSLARDGAVAGLRGEPFAVLRNWRGPVLFELDRGIV